MIVLLWIAIFAAALGGFVYLVLPYGSRPMRALATGLFAMLVAGAFLGGPELLSRPKPVNLEWMRAAATRAEVLHSVLVEDVGIYLWLRLPGVAEPRSYVLPWNRDLAMALAETKRRAGEQGIEMSRPFQRSWDRRQPPVFHPAPQPMLPPKGGEERPEPYEQPPA